MLILSGTDVWTFADAVQYLLDTNELDTRIGINNRQIKSAGPGQQFFPLPKMPLSLTTGCGTNGPFQHQTVNRAKVESVRENAVYSAILGWSGKRPFPFSRLLP